MNVNPTETSKIRSVPDAMESTSTNCRPEKRRRLMQELPESTLSPVTAFTQTQSGIHDYGACARQQDDPVGKGGPEHENTEVSLPEGLGSSRNTSSRCEEIVCFGAVRLSLNF